MSNTQTPICMAEEYWANSHFSVARYSGGIKAFGHEYQIVNKQGATLFELSDRHSKYYVGDGQQKAIEPGEPADLCRTDFILFYKKLAGNVSADYTRDKLDSQLKSQFLTCLQPASAKISEMGIRYSALPGHTLELSEAMDDALTEKWSGERGIKIVSVSVNSVTIPPEDEATLKELQKTAVFRNTAMGAAYTTMAQGEAMKAAAANSAGAMTGFMGMGMAQQAGGVNAAQLYQMAENQRASAPAPTAAPTAAPADGWKCSCGNLATGKFCTECGAKKPEANGWTCSCGTVNKGKFCSECGAKKPAAAPLYRCDKCGWEPEDPKNPPKFCPECGDRFTEDDIR